MSFPANLVSADMTHLLEGENAIIHGARGGRSGATGRTRRGSVG
jgi:hypothetical protein